MSSIIQSCDRSSLVLYAVGHTEQHRDNVSIHRVWLPWGRDHWGPSWSLDTTITAYWWWHQNVILSEFSYSVIGTLFLIICLTFVPAHFSGSFSSFLLILEPFDILPINIFCTYGSVVGRILRWTPNSSPCGHAIYNSLILSLRRNSECDSSLLWLSYVRW